MFSQHATREILDLAERFRLKPACALKPKAEAADAGKEVEHLKLVHPRLSPRIRAD